MIIRFSGNQPASHSEESGGEDAEVVDEIEAVPKRRDEEDGHHSVALRRTVVHALPQPPHRPNVPVVQNLFGIQPKLQYKQY